MRIDLAGKPIAITGASSGIGAATALACARAGMPVALGARRADRLAQLVEQIKREGGRAIAVAMDVARPEDCRRLIDETVREFGSIYSVYANAGYGAEYAVHDMTDAQMRDIFEVNFFGTLSTIRPAIEHMLKAPHPLPDQLRGHILICSSCVARMALPYYSAYSATKAAQAHIGRAMNLELRPHGIRVSTVHPIGTKTEFFHQVKHKSGVHRLVEHTSERFMQTPEFVARCTVACLRRPRPEVWPGFRGRFVRFGMSICTLFPRVTDFAVRKMVDERLNNDHERRSAEAKRATPLSSGG
jgi:3-oxoacyl-[acyl-carrier protein] reductase